MSQMTRRDLLIRGSQLTIGAAVGAVALESLAGRAVQAQTPSPSTTPAATPVPPTPTPDPTGWPWKYVKLDPDVVAQKAYDSYYQAGCMFGTFNAIVVALREAYGPPYNMVPTMMARYGGGGAVSWGSLCGALNGSALAMNLVLKDYTAPINDLFYWYTKTAFPQYKPASPKKEISATSVSDSILCHVSVSRWAAAAKVKSESPERAERCARLTADVAAQAVRILNDVADGKFKATYVASQTLQECGACHLKGGTIENTNGKMECTQCHTENIIPSAAIHPAK